MASYVIGIDLVANDMASSELQNASDNITNFENAQNNAAGAADAMTDATTNQASAFDDLVGKLNTAIVAYGAMQLAGKVVEMYQLGESVRITNDTFVQLSGGAETANANLQLMRNATGGIVDDMTLMAGANRLLLMGLADTGDEAAKLEQIAVSLGRAMGHDAGQSIEDFAALLANQSIPRLDNFGISSDKVRAKIEELKNAGMGAQEAFKMAVLEQGAVALDRLGTSANAAITPINQLGTTLNNVAQEFSARFATGLNALIGIVEYSAGVLPQQTAAAQEAVQSAASQMTQILPDVVKGMGAEGDLNFIGKFIQKMLEEVAADPSVANDAAALGAKVFEAIGGEDAASKANLSFDSAFDGLTSYSEVFQVMASNVLQVKNNLDYTSQSMAAMDAATQRSEQQAAAFQQRAARDHAVAYYNAYTQAYSGLTQQSPAEAIFGLSDAQVQQAAEAASQLMHDAMIRQGQANQEIGSFLMTAPPELTGAGDMGAQAEALKSQYEEMATTFEHLQDLNKDGLVSDDDLSKAEGLLNSFKDTADQADRISKMDLSQIFGQSDGGLMGQMTDDLIAKMKESGKSDAEIAAMKQTLDLQSGRETAASVAYSQDVIPLLNDIASLSPEDAAKAVQNLQTFMQMATVKGMTPDQMAALMPQATGYGYTGAPGQAFSVQPGQTPGMLAAQYGMSVQDILAATGAPNAGMMMPGQYQFGGGVGAIPGFSMDALLGASTGGGAAGGSPLTGGMDTGALAEDIQAIVEPSASVQDSFSGIKTSTSGIKSDVADLREGLETLSKGTHIIDIELKIKNLDFINALVTGGGVAQNSTLQTNRDKGGQSPGVDSRTVN